MKILPRDVVDSIVSVDFKTKLQDITRRQKLLIDQAGKLEMETTLVMIGLEPLTDFIGNIERELTVPNLRAKEIAQDVSESIFKPIRESLRKVNEDMETAGSGEDTGGVEIQQATGAEVSQGKTTEKEIGLVQENPDMSRNQILNEIENPHLIGQTITENPSREIETLDEVPFQQDIKINRAVNQATAAESAMPAKQETSVPRLNVLETKMAGMTITPQRVVNAEPEVKLPPIEKKRPTSGVDPYREPIA